jgi:carboxylesterase type B
LLRLVETQVRSPFLDSQRSFLGLLNWANCRGAKSVAAHIFAFNGRDDNLFRGAILESGAPATGIYWPATSDYSQAQYDLVVSRAGCSSAINTLACLRRLDFTTLYDALRPSDEFSLPFYLPSIDRNFIAESPSQQLVKGNYVKIPTIQGHNIDEGAMFTAFANSNSEDDTKAFFSSTCF